MASEKSALLQPGAPAPPYEGGGQQPQYGAGPQPLYQAQYGAGPQPLYQAQYGAGQPAQHAMSLPTVVVAGMGGGQRDPPCQHSGCQYPSIATCEFAWQEKSSGCCGVCNTIEDKECDMLLCRQHMHREKNGVTYCPKHRSHGKKTEGGCTII